MSDHRTEHQPHGAPGSTGSRRIWLVGGLAILAGAGWSWWRSPGVAEPSVRPSAQPPSSSKAPSSAQPTATNAEQLGTDFWALSLPKPDEQMLVMAQLQGQPLLINFWATWCPPCVREMPLLDRFHQAHARHGLQVLGVAVDGPTPVRSYLAKSPVGFPVVMAGADGSTLARTLGNAQGGLPYTVLADAQGRIIRRQMGELQAEQLTEWAGLLKRSD